ncbi:MAG: DHHA1 domain-containing protein, partial [Nitrospirota bacterium]|nr:DHHA1 domain-containing protein [Nitrospirota bacterium]
MHRRWFLNRTNAEFISYLSRTASISPVFSQILINRGIKTSAEVQDFLHPGITGLSDPFDLQGVREAVERIKVARRQGERVFIHGDYDADGLTATAIMVSALRTAGLDVLYFIPHRMTHGYGFNLIGVEAARKAGAKLIITVDCGIGSFEAAAHAHSLNIDLIITDHHEPERTLDVTREALGEKTDNSLTSHSFRIPHAVAVINPKLTLHESRLTVLCGAGIAFKLAHAMAMDNDIAFSEDDLLPLLDLAALGTVADVVPLTGENRIIIKEAMQHIQDGSRLGMRALKQAAGLDKRQMKAGHLAFTMVPRINAAGRMGDAQDVVRLFLSDSEQEAYDLAAWLDRTNSERKKVEEIVCQDALSQLKGTDPAAVIMLAKEGWHPGVLGIVASKVAESYNLPAFIFAIENGIAKGSSRSIPAFDICAGLSECRDLLISFGGHKQAAGVKLRAADLPALQQRLRQIIQRDVSPEDLVPTLEIHASVLLGELTNPLMRELEQLEPFGYGNPEPLLGARELEMMYPKVLKDRHLKMKLRKNASYLDAIGWDMGHLLEDLSQATIFDAVFTPSYNDWNGNRSIQLVLKGLRP